MKNTFGKLLVGASMAIGMGALAANPAQAGTLTGATIGGTAASDYYVYGVSGNNTVKINNPTTTDLKNALTGDATSPTGNVELRATSEQANFDFSKNTTLSGKIGGKDIILSSLTASDWTNTYKNGKSFGKYWFDSALTANGFGSLIGTTIGTGFFNVFANNGGFQRFSDPNISYVNQNDTTGLISIGLAGHLNATPLLLPYFTAYVNSLSSGSLKTQATQLKAALAVTSTQASEIVKYTYNGVTDYKFSFTATDSKLVSNDGTNSHNGNYEVTIDGVPPTTVPEPSVMLGLFGVAGIVAAQRKLKKVSA
ncbi:NF038130 family PEP-CTERM protein [Trichormus variabilis]|nr:NF038130 family PEP-CTERM protein [Trichormus variabilis]MBD2627687.1 NF038130 family PEP-CTERM protein [Trichormus variabilis FACHB-164]